MYLFKKKRICIHQNIFIIIFFNIKLIQVDSVLVGLCNIAFCETIWNKYLNIIKMLDGLINVYVSFLSILETLRENDKL